MSDGIAGSRQMLQPGSDLSVTSSSKEPKQGAKSHGVARPSRGIRKDLLIGQQGRALTAREGTRQLAVHGHREVDCLSSSPTKQPRTPNRRNGLAQPRAIIITRLLNRHCTGDMGRKNETAPAHCRMA
mmetsp:Transcript_157166/g.504224  ORF Transcript_157166/g.504224 Transcript_157166/m.504224 type:complete len:128 (+) Transcript_157166:1390-1773(+)